MEQLKATQLAVPNFILGFNTSQETEIATTQVRTTLQKQLKTIVVPGEEPKLLDLQRVEVLFEVDGYVSFADRNKIRNIFFNRGTTFAAFDNEVFPGNIEKLDLDIDERDDDALPIKFTFKRGVNIGTGENLE